MAQAKTGDKVKVHYTGKLDDGTVFDSSENGDPLAFTVGEGEVIPGFEKAVVGMQPGDCKSVDIDSRDAYGDYNDEMVMEIPRDQFPSDVEPEVGQQLQVSQPNGESFVVNVTDISDTTITLDANHPLAGETLTFDICLVEID